MEDESTATAQTSAGDLRITKARLKQWSVCSDGCKWFLRRFESGEATYGDVQRALRADERYADARWLTERAFGLAMDTPTATREITADTVCEALEIIDATTAMKVDADASQTAEDERISSSDYGAQIGSSGYDAQIGSSGDDARINAEGASSVIASAGRGARVRSGESGAVAMAYHDGTRVRFAVGYVGEGLRALTWYELDERGEFVEVLS